jgi:hypothetical protein
LDQADGEMALQMFFNPISTAAYPDRYAEREERRNAIR